MLAISMMSTKVSEETKGETDLPAQQPSTCQATWVPSAYADTWRAGDYSHASPPGSDTAVRMIGRVGDRATFRALERRGRRVRRGLVSVVYVPDAEPRLAGSATPFPRVAFGVGRRLGPAVTRNKVRRRLRHIMRELDGRPNGLVPGSYLVTVHDGAAQLPYAELRRFVAEACGAVRADQRRELART